MNHFIFVVCGNREHIDTLNFSLKYLKRFSSANIHVITDKSRNDAQINHDSIIDIKTPEKYNHHEASIFLKTSVHKYLDMNKDNEYCYLDSDVVAISEDINNIFNLVPEPVLFAPDHDSIDSFSPYAMHCGCLEAFDDNIKKLTRSLKEINPSYNHQNPYRQKEEKRLMLIFDRIKKSPLKHRKKILRYLSFRFIIPVKEFEFSDGFRFNKDNLCWKNARGNIISFDYPRLSKKLSKEQNITFDNQLSLKTLSRTISCNHLRNYINKQYNLEIPEKWQHWNGGVFRFNSGSIQFLEQWHKLCIEEFNNPLTRTRDQGMLAVTAWKQGIESSKTLPIKFNFITEYNNTDVSWHASKGYTYNDFNTIFKPCFLHIYHHWGDNNWSIWKSVLNLHIHGNTNTK